MKYLTLLIVLLFVTVNINSGSLTFDRFKALEKISVQIKEQREHQAKIKLTEKQNLTILIIARIESNFNRSALNENENAVGLLQTRPIMVAEINRLLGSNTYSLSDRWSTKKSIEMFIDYQNIVNPEWDFEKSARLWNGGIAGMKKESTDVYWNLFSSCLLEA